MGLRELCIVPMVRKLFRARKLTVKNILRQSRNVVSSYTVAHETFGCPSLEGQVLYWACAQRLFDACTRLQGAI